eukprot:4940453-Prymnesium_polylepis.1
MARAQYIVQNGTRMGAEFKVRPEDIVKANEKLNLGFVAALFNACPGLDPPDEVRSRRARGVRDGVLRVACGWRGVAYTWRGVLGACLACASLGGARAAPQAMG